MSWLCLGQISLQESERTKEQLLAYTFIHLLIMGSVDFPTPSVTAMPTLLLWYIVVIGLRGLALLARERVAQLSIRINPGFSEYLPLLLAAVIFLLQVQFSYFVILATQNEIAFGVFLLFENIYILADLLYVMGITLVDAASRNGWEIFGFDNGRGALVRFISDSTAVLHLVVLILQHVHVIIFFGLKLEIGNAFFLFHLRNAVVSLTSKISARKQYTRAVHALTHLYKDATPEELERFNDDCAICMDRMSAAKILPCGHIFHSGCLRDWLLEQNSCPTCRYSLTENRAASAAPGAPAAPTAPAPAAAAATAEVRPAGPDAGGAPGARTFTLDSSQLPPWLPLPRFSFTVSHQSNGSGLFRPPLNQQTGPGAMVQMVQEILPHTPEQAIVAALARTGNVDAAVDLLLNSTDEGEAEDLHVPEPRRGGMRGRLERMRQRQLEQVDQNLHPDSDSSGSGTPPAELEDWEDWEGEDSLQPEPRAEERRQPEETAQGATAGAVQTEAAIAAPVAPAQSAEAELRDRRQRAHEAALRRLMANTHSV
eukprot:TRINITY_DN1620_c0_g1_i1.p1 TRINITY_DN1620_c0_g1~~TRINITY_DN1620_c0_g1_i1.p1  ORF type:complete len:612 (+),score=113.80 TRINITY_DN1620_c0_g1_i1:215-1837(+)